MRFALAGPQGKSLLVMNSERCNNPNLHPKDLIMTNVSMVVDVTGKVRCICFFFRCVGYLFQKVGKVAAMSLGGGLLLLPVILHSPYSSIYGHVCRMKYAESFVHPSSLCR